MVPAGEQEKPNGPLSAAIPLAEGILWSLTEAQKSDDAAERALHIRRALRLCLEVKLLLLGVP